MQVIFHRLANEEATRAARRLGRESARKQERFSAAVYSAARRIEANPGIGTPVMDVFRWVRAGRFKHILYYRQLSDDLVLVYAVAHASRRPGYWLRRTHTP